MARKAKPPIAAWIVEQRKARGLKPADLAARLGVAETTIRGWETGRGVGPDNVASLERLFGLAAPDAPQPADMTALVTALGAQTKAIADLVLRLDGRTAALGEAKSSDVDEATKRRRRVYWMERAAGEKLSVALLRRRMEWPSGHDSELKALLEGKMPKGAALTQISHGLNLPVHVLEDPPGQTDEERLAMFRQEALVEIRTEDEPAERERRSA